MYKYARTRTVALVISAIALVVIALFSARTWQEERNQACSAQWLAYNTTANTVKNLGGSADIDKVLGKLRDFAERCLPEGTENDS
ncbi:MAG: hypothetical protein P6E94_02090 [Acidimicrobiales bacterium]|nr:hypothetical protein [Acidimicrobiales bacterium]|tara:strand:+ start:167 stop:421 length:255 start_codon:yes stop_codon:yes gene_type:complete